jgi:DNA-binding MarR family transcriptional regulator
MKPNAAARVSKQTRPPRLLYLVRRWFVGARAMLEDITRDHGMTAGDYTLLSFIAVGGPCSAADIARAMRITPQAATQQVAQLETKHLVSRRENPANRRIALIELSNSGRVALKDIDARVDRLEAELTAGLSKAELNVIRTFLSRPPGHSAKEKP